mgnify:FL=1
MTCVIIAHIIVFGKRDNTSILKNTGRKYQMKKTEKTMKSFAKALITASVKGSANSAATTFMYQPKKPEGLEKFSKLGK